MSPVCKLALTGAALLLGACSVTTSAGRNAASAEAALAAAKTPVAKGRILYDTSCARCHALYMPRSYTAGEWRYYVRKYGKRARLDKSEQALVLTYLKEHCLPE